MSETVPLRPAGTQPWASGWRRLLLAAGMLVYPGITAASIHVHSVGYAAVTGYVIVLAFCVCYVAAMLLVRPDRRLPFWILLAIMTVLFVVELRFAKIDAFYLCAVVAALVVLPLRGWAAPVVVVAAAAGLVVPILIPSWHSGLGWTRAVMIVFTALIWYAFAELPDRTTPCSRHGPRLLGSRRRRNATASRGTCTISSVTL